QVAPSVADLDDPPVQAVVEVGDGGRGRLQHDVRGGLVQVPPERVEHAVRPVVAGPLHQPGEGGSPGGDGEAEGEVHDADGAEHGRGQLPGADVEPGRGGEDVDRAGGAVEEEDDGGGGQQPQ